MGEELRELREGPAPESLEGLTSAKAAELQQTFGFNEVVAKEEPLWLQILRRYLGVIPLIMFVAAIIAISVKSDSGDRDYVSFALLIFEINLIVVVSHFSDRNAGNAVKEIQSLMAPTCLVKRDGKFEKLPARELVPGDLLELRGGDVLPADAKIVGTGETLKVDESSLTGESLPVTKRTGDEVLSGSVITQGEREALVTATGPASFFGKTMVLLQQQGGQEVGHLQQVLNIVSYFVVAIAFAGCLAILIVNLARSVSVGESFLTFFVVLTAVVPIGMPVVTTTVLAVGSRELAQEKAVVTRLSAMEELSGLEILCSDKTGTLTKNELELDRNEIMAKEGFTTADVLRYASIASKGGDHVEPIDKAIMGAMTSEDFAVTTTFTVSRFVPFNPVDKRTEATVTSPKGETFLISKGAPNVVRDSLEDPAERAASEAFIREKAARGLRSLGVMESRDGGATWGLVGFLPLLDPPRDDSAATLKRAQELGLEVKMITGDQLAIAEEMCRRLGLGSNIAPATLLREGHIQDLSEFVENCDGFAGVFPEHKFQIVEALQKKGKLVGMTGDGVNDAPALKKANVGIAVAGATAAAQGAADIILNAPGLSTIITAIVRSRKIFARLEAYLIYRLASSVCILLFFFFSIIVVRLEFPSWVLIFLSLINDFTVMATSKDKVYSSSEPRKWNMLHIILLAVVIGVSSFLGCFILLLLADLEYWNWWHLFGLHPYRGLSVVDAEAILVASTFLNLAIAIQLNIFSSRARFFAWWWTPSTIPRPSLYLIAPVGVSLLISTFIAVYWPKGAQLGGGGADEGHRVGRGWRRLGLPAPVVPDHRQRQGGGQLRVHGHQEGGPRAAAAGGALHPRGLACGGAAQGHAECQQAGTSAAQKGEGLTGLRHRRVGPPAHWPHPCARPLAACHGPGDGRRRTQEAAAQAHRCAGEAGACGEGARHGGEEREDVVDATRGWGPEGDQHPRGRGRAPQDSITCSFRDWGSVAIVIVPSSKFFATGSLLTCLVAKISPPAACYCPLWPRFHHQRFAIVPGSKDFAISSLLLCLVARFGHQRFVSVSRGNDFATSGLLLSLVAKISPPAVEGQTRPEDCNLMRKMFWVWALSHLFTAAVIVSLGSSLVP